MVSIYGAYSNGPERFQEPAFFKASELQKTDSAVAALSMKLPKNWHEKFHEELANSKKAL